MIDQLFEFMTNDLINPGQKLQQFLRELYPVDSTVDENVPLSFIEAIDYDMIAEQKFINLIYDSSINYLVRRFIMTAEYLRRKYSGDDFPAEQWINELRSFLRNKTRLEDDNIEKMLALLQECLNARNQKLNKRIRNRIRKRDRNETNDELRCYMCGISLTTENQQDEIQIEHLFPRALGGITEDFNLKVACKWCNDRKANYIDSSDFHYEEICLVSDKKDENFDAELKRQYKIAVSAKSQFRCAVCDKSASEYGQLNYGRIDLSDSWHFLNMEVYCNEHNPESE